MIKDYFFQRSSDGGLAFKRPSLITDSTVSTTMRSPTIGLSSYNDNIYLIFGNTTSLIFSKSTNAGDNFDTPVVLGKSEDLVNLGHFRPAIAVSNNDTIFITWINRVMNQNNVYFTKSDGVGLTSPPRILKSFEWQQRTPDPVILYDSRNSALHIVWNEHLPVEGVGRFPFLSTIYTKSTDNGDNFIESKPITENVFFNDMAIAR